jgi:hypothetical protein
MAYNTLAGEKVMQCKKVRRPKDKAMPVEKVQALDSMIG